MEAGAQNALSIAQGYKGVNLTGGDKAAIGEQLTGALMQT
jgi:hypothetical protein